MRFVAAMAHITVAKLSESERKLQVENYDSCRRGSEYIRTNPGNCTLPVGYGVVKDRIYNLKVGEGDVFVFGWMKTGTTWMREMVWLLMNDCDIEEAKRTLLNKRIPFIDMAALASFEGNIKEELGMSAEEWIDNIENFPSPKILKSHLPFDLLPPNLLDDSKVIMCLRNPKDTAVSAFHHEKLLKMFGFRGDFPTFFDLLLRNLTCYSSYFQYTADAWKRRDHPNMLIIFFEDMKEDLPSVVKKVAQFLEREVTEEQVEMLCDHLSFKRMKKNDSVNNEAIRKVAFVPGREGAFIRKGEVGDWKNYFTEEMNVKMDDVIDSYFKDIGLMFRYEL